MRYCTKCKRLIKNNDMTNCPVCKKKTFDDPSYYSPVHIATANGFELERIKAALGDAGIPCTCNEARRDAGLQILNSAPPENCDIYVPLSAYQEAWDILVGIGAISAEEEPEPDADDPMLQKAKKDAREEKELDPAKAKRIRIMSLIAFFVIIALVVWLTDIVFELIKGAFV